MNAVEVKYSEQSRVLMNVADVSLSIPADSILVGIKLKSNRLSTLVIYLTAKVETLFQLASQKLIQRKIKYLFLWQPWPELWQGVYVSGDGRSQIDVTIDSAYSLNNFSTISFEPTDKATAESR